MSWTVADVMTKDPVTVGSATSFKACVNLMRIHEMSALPVVDRDCRIVGIVSESDLLAKEARPPGGNAKAVRAGELMTTDLVMTTAEATLATAASLMFQHHVKVLPVVDTRMRLVGMVSRAQVLKVFLRSDESIRKEVVRSIADAPALELRGSEIEVKDGVVNVYGTTEADGPAALIVARVMAVPGVVGIRYHPTLPTEAAVAEMSHGGGRHG